MLQSDHVTAGLLILGLNPMVIVTSHRVYHFDNLDLMDRMCLIANTFHEERKNSIQSLVAGRCSKVRDTATNWCC